jgi:hypothetical protein
MAALLYQQEVLVTYIETSNELTKLAVFQVLGMFIKTPPMVTNAGLTLVFRYSPVVLESPWQDSIYIIF